MLSIYNGDIWYQSDLFLATKCLQGLGQKNVVLGAKAVLKHFYVDNCLNESESLLTAKEIQQQLNIILGSAGLK